ncbi:hypothetical protein [Thermomonospora echinospora]|uniref:hypothetical protein n=1 Tax=Thermomonospora echinospora TaxID=1992 RepID=UPI0011B06FCE|nr:hypothetical protein [Thermomonospora echinospora]
MAGAVIALLVIAGAGAAYFLTRPAASVRLNLVADTQLAALELPGEPSGSCGTRVCRSILRVDRSDETRPVKVTAQGALPEGVRLAYWGCAEGPGAATCTVRPDRDTTICVTTTGPADVARKACGTRPGPPVSAASGKLTVLFNTEWDIKVFGNFEEPCTNGGVLGRKCQITMKPGKIYYLRSQPADPSPPGQPNPDYNYADYEGCDSGMGHGSAGICIVFGATTAKTVCLSTGDPAEQRLARECLAYRKAQTP